MTSGVSSRRVKMGLRNRAIFDKQGNVYFVTTTVMNHDRIFALGDRYCNIIIDSLKYQINEHKTKLIAFVIMPSHLHFIMSFPEGESLIDFMRDFKKFTSVKIRQQLEADKNYEQLQILKKNSVKSKNQVFKLWMDRFDDFVITKEETLQQKYDYIHMNPVKAGLAEKPEDWKYSSARNYFLDDNTVINIP